MPTLVGGGSVTAPGSPTNVIFNDAGVIGANGNWTTDGLGDTTQAGQLLAKQIGPVYECDQFPGANASVKVTNCNAAAVAAGGGVIDLRNLGGQPISSPEVETQMMVWGDATGHYSVTVLLPPAATWSWALNSSTTCGIQVNDMVDVAGEASLAGANRMVIEAGSGTFTMDSLMCTNTAVGFEYVKARGFHLSNGNSAATFLNGLLHVVGMWDSSSIEYFSIFNSYGDMVHIDGACCGASMRHFGVYGSGPSTNTGGMNIKLGTGYVMFNSTITNGSTNVCMASGGTLNSTYVGKQVNGPGIALQTVAAVTSPSCITLTTPATASSTGSEVLIYGGTNQTAFNLTLEDFAANWPGINEPIIMIPPVLSGSSPHNITIANGYSEGNGEFDTTTPDIYIPYPADAIFIKGFQQDHGFNSTKYTVENHTPGEVEISGLYSGNSNLNDVVTGVQIPTSNSVTFPFYSESGFADPELANATCFSGNTYGKLLKITCPLTSVVNLVTDSAFSQGPTNWTTINGTTTFNPGLGYQGDGAIVFTGTGATTGNLIVSETVNLPVQNQTYFFSTAAVVPANVPAGAGPIRIAICDIATCFVQLASTSIVSGTNGVVSGTFNNGTHTSITILYQIPGVAVPNGDQIIFSEPFIKLGSTPAGYVVGDAFGATNANNGLSLSSLKIGVSAVQPTVTGTVSSTTGTTTTAHTFSAPFTSTPPCVGTPTTNAGAWYFSTPPSTTSTGVITYTGTAPQSFNISCTGAGGVW